MENGSISKENVDTEIDMKIGCSQLSLGKIFCLQGLHRRFKGSKILTQMPKVKWVSFPSHQQKQALEMKMKISTLSLSSSSTHI